MIAQTSQDLLRWNEGTSSIWKKHLHSRPELTTYPCDIRGGETVADLLQHIVAVELSYSERLNGEHETPFEEIPKISVDSLYEFHDRALKKLRVLEGETDAFWSERIDFETRGGQFSATLRVVFAHCLLHSIRHNGQVATLLRKENAGVSAMFDYLAFGDAGRMQNLDTSTPDEFRGSSSCLKENGRSQSSVQCDNVQCA